MTFNKIFSYILFFGLVFNITNFILNKNHFWDQLPEVVHVKIAGQVIKVELAITPEARARGLSGRQGLTQDEGMLFVFDTPGKYPFWMKDMNFAIDMIWISEDSKVVYIKKDARIQCSSRIGRIGKVFESRLGNV